MSPSPADVRAFPVEIFDRARVQAFGSIFILLYNCEWSRLQTPQRSAGLIKKSRKPYSECWNPWRWGWIVAVCASLDFWLSKDHLSKSNFHCSSWQAEDTTSVSAALPQRDLQPAQLLSLSPTCRFEFLLNDQCHAVWLLFDWIHHLPTLTNRRELVGTTWLAPTQILQNIVHHTIIHSYYIHIIYYRIKIITIHYTFTNHVKTLCSSILYCIDFFRICAARCFETRPQKSSWGSPPTGGMPGGMAAECLMFWNLLMPCQATPNIILPYKSGMCGKNITVAAACSFACSVFRIFILLCSTLPAAATGQASESPVFSGGSAACLW